MFPLEFRPGSPPVSHRSYAKRSLLCSLSLPVTFLIFPWLLGSSTYILILMLVMLINYIIETNPHCVAHPGLTVTVWDYRICHIGLSRIGPHSSSIWMLYHYEVLLSGLGSVALLDEVCCWIFKCSSHAQCVSLPAACESRCTTLNPFSSTMSPCMLPCFLPS